MLCIAFLWDVFNATEDNGGSPGARRRRGVGAAEIGGAGVEMWSL